MRNRVYFGSGEGVSAASADMKKIIRSVIKRTLENEKFPYGAEISVTFVTDDEIHEMNREYRGKDKPTDVLSFPLTNGEPEAEDIIDGVAALGDIVISVETAARQAAEYGHSIERETAFLTVHSMLHLLGYDHEVSEEDEKYMNDTCEAILAKEGLFRNTAKPEEKK